MKIEISNSCIETMLRCGIIHDYTDDGYVLHGNGGWLPAGDVIEFYLGMEEFELEQAREKVQAAEAQQRRSDT
tara:strand:+ start:295 stop:513 length:219 start_codon:yes stop_codon:yes gene_type:complete